MDPWDPANTPGAIWIVPVMVAMALAGVFVSVVLMPYLEARRQPKPRRKRRLPR